MKNTYSSHEFRSLIGRTTTTLQKWDQESVLKAHQSIAQRRYTALDPLPDLKKYKKKIIEMTKENANG